MTSEKDKMLKGELYDPNDPQLIAERERAQRLTNSYNQMNIDEQNRREELLNKLLGSVGEKGQIRPPFRCDYGYNIHIDDNFYLNFDCIILDVCCVKIGENCLIGPGVHIYTATHPLDMNERIKGQEYGEPVTIGDNVWIGGEAVVNPGVTIGDNSVISSGAVVNSDVPNGVIVQGNPAKVIKDLE